VGVIIIKLISRLQTPEKMVKDVKNLGEDYIVFKTQVLGDLQGSKSLPEGHCKFFEKNPALLPVLCKMSIFKRKLMKKNLLWTKMKFHGRQGKRGHGKLRSLPS
jgi:hypothetical protein